MLGTTIVPKEIRDEYGHRILKALDKSKEYVKNSFSFREKIEISAGLIKERKKEVKKFKENLEWSILDDIISGLNVSPLYKESRNANDDRFVRCVRVQSKVKEYVRMDEEKIKDFPLDLYIRQDDSDLEIYGFVSKETVKKYFK